MITLMRVFCRWSRVCHTGRIFLEIYGNFFVFGQVVDGARKVVFVSKVDTARRLQY